MSGIAGIIHFDGRPVEPGLIEKMTGAMAHRGPDGIDHWTKGSVALGQCMLRTTPESLEEHQPLTNEDESLVLVMDGRVDNWEELRQDLLDRGAKLRNRSDAELVLRAYETYGDDFLKHIDGDFALVIWDSKLQEVFCARDRMGNKTFIYHWNGNTFVFASELHAILAMPWVRQESNEGILAEFLANEWYSRDETFWKGIMRLVAAQWMKVEAEGLNFERYWQPDFGDVLPLKNKNDFVEYYRALFADIVRRKSRSHYPVGYEVSGGLDSSAIFAMAEHLHRHQKLPVPAIEGFTLNFDNDSDANELEYVQAVEDHLNLRIHKIPPSLMPLSWYRELGKVYHDFPGYPNGIMGLGLRQKARENGNRVVLVGVGGDQLLCEAFYYAEELASWRFDGVVKCFKKDIQNVGLITSFWWLFRYGMIPLLPESAKRSLRPIKSRLKKNGTNGRFWLTSSMRKVLKERQLKYKHPAVDYRMFGQYGKYLSWQSPYTSLVNELEERMSASVGIELRRPFWDAKLLQFTISMPARYRSQGGTEKNLHRQAMKGLLPQLVLTRQTKAEFSVVYNWLLHEMKEELTHTIPEKRDAWIDAIYVDKVYKLYENSSYSGYSGLMLWNLFGCDCIN